MTAADDKSVVQAFYVTRAGLPALLVLDAAGLQGDLAPVLFAARVASTIILNTKMMDNSCLDLLAAATQARSTTGLGLVCVSRDVRKAIKDETLRKAQAMIALELPAECYAAFEKKAVHFAALPMADDEDTEEASMRPVAEALPALVSALHEALRSAPPLDSGARLLDALRAECKQLPVLAQSLSTLRRLQTSTLPALRAELLCEYFAALDAFIDVRASWALPHVYCYPDFLFYLFSLPAVRFSGGRRRVL